MQYVVQRVPAVDSEGFSLPPPPSKEDSILDLAVLAVSLLECNSIVMKR